MKIIIASCICMEGTRHSFLKAIVEGEEPTVELICLFGEGDIDPNSDLVIHDNCHHLYFFNEAVKRFEENGGSVIRLRSETGNFRSLGSLRIEIAEHCKQIREHKKEV